MPYVVHKTTFLSNFTENEPEGLNTTNLGAINGGVYLQEGF